MDEPHIISLDITELSDNELLLIKEMLKKQHNFLDASKVRSLERAILELKKLKIIK